MVNHARFVAEKAWKSKNTGRFKIKHTNLKQSRHPDAARVPINHYIVVKDKKMLVLRKNEQKGSKGHFDIAVFPKPEHMNAFEEASDGVATLGPAFDNPAAVGTVRINVGDTARIDFAQAHFRTTKKLFGKKPTLKRSLATKYYGWRRRAFEEALDVMKESGKPMNVAKYATDNRVGHGNNFFEDLRSACDKKGLELKRNMMGNYDIVKKEPKINTDEHDVII